MLGLLDVDPGGGGIGLPDNDNGTRGLADAIPWFGSSMLGALGTLGPLDPESFSPSRRSDCSF